MSAGRYFVRQRGQVTGPFSIKRLIALREAGKLGRIDEVRPEDDEEWCRADSLEPVFPKPVSPAPQQAAAAGTGAGGSAAPAGDAAVFTDVTVVTQWYYLDPTNQKQGPVPEAEMAILMARGDVRADTMVWKDGLADWVRLADSELGPALQGAAGDEPRTSSLATASLVLAMLWLCGLGSLLAVLFGFMALSEIRASGDQLRGRQRAITGLVLGFVLLILTPVAVLGTLYFMGRLDTFFK